MPDREYEIGPPYVHTAHCNSSLWPPAAPKHPVGAVPRIPRAGGAIKGRGETTHRSGAGSDRRRGQARSVRLGGRRKGRRGGVYCRAWAAGLAAVLAATLGWRTLSADVFRRLRRRWSVGLWRVFVVALGRVARHVLLSSRRLAARRVVQSHTSQSPPRVWRRSAGCNGGPHPPACTNESFSESRETRRNLTRRQLPGDAAAVSGPIRDFLSVRAPS